MVERLNKKRSKTKRRRMALKMFHSDGAIIETSSPNISYLCLFLMEFVSDNNNNWKKMEEPLDPIIFIRFKNMSSYTAQSFWKYLFGDIVWIVNCELFIVYFSSESKLLHWSEANDSLGILTLFFIILGIN